MSVTASCLGASPELVIGRIVYVLVLPMMLWAGEKGVCVRCRSPNFAV
jgi:hypothetical protein